LTNGNYNATTFINHLDTVLDGLGVSGSTFTPSYSSTNGKMTIVSSNLTEFSIISNEQNFRYLGMPPNTTVASASGTWISPRVIDLAGTRYIDIWSNLPLDSTNTRNQDKGILARVYPNADNWGQILYNKESFDFCRLLTDRVNSISIRLLDEFGNTVDLNGTDWNMTIELRDGKKN